VSERLPEIKIKLEAEAFSEILFAVTHSESGAEDSKNVLRLESHHNKHWPAKSRTQLRCRVLFSRPEKGNCV
jgi:hypothetical protein